jgi:hypothetical protein
MNEPLGVALILAGTAAAAGDTVAGSGAMRAGAVVALAVAGVAAGAGALLVQDRRIDLVNWAATLVLAGIFVPVHAWIALGPPRAGASG